MITLRFIIWIVSVVSFGSSQPGYLEWIEETGGEHSGHLTPCLDCSSGAVHLPSSFPFGNTSHSSIYVSSNGLISFDEEFINYIAIPFHSTNDSLNYLVAPYWTDNDARLRGNISWAMYSRGESSQSNTIIERINAYIRQETMMRSFNGVLVFVATWTRMESYPANDPFVYKKNNTYQAVLVTDGSTKSFAIFTYQCGAMEWSGNRSVIGFNAGGSYYTNHPLSSTQFSNSVSCLNGESVWNNIVYDLMSTQQPFIEEFEPAILCSSDRQCTEFVVTDSIFSCCATEGMSSYIADYRCWLCDGNLEWLEKTGINGGHISPCDDCSSEEITFPSHFPFGNTSKTSVYVSSNGLISFDTSYSHHVPTSFPSTIFNNVYYRYIVAPYWADNVVRDGGEVSWEVYSRGDSYKSGLIIDRVTLFVKSSSNDTSLSDFNGTFVFVVNWTDVEPILRTTNMNNSYQAVLITDGTRSFAIFTYKCGAMEWSRSQSTIGFNAGGYYYSTHPLSSTPFSNAIACLNNGSSVWNNLFYDLTNSTSSSPHTGSSESETLLCSNSSQCSGFFTMAGVYNCCSTVGAYTYISQSRCHYCFEYGWVKDVSPDLRTSSLEMDQISVREGDTINLTVYFLQNGPASQDSYTLTITTGGTAIENVDYILNTTRLELTDVPVGVSLRAVDNDDDVYKRIKTIMLELSQANSTNYVTDHLCLNYKRVLIHLEDNDIVTIGFEKVAYTLREGGLLEVVVNKSVPCDFDNHFQVHSPGLIDENLIFRSIENRVLISVNLTDDGVALEPDEIHILTLSLVVSDPQVQLWPNTSYITIVDNDNMTTVGFNEVSRSVSENEGIIYVAVNLMDEVGVPVSVDIVGINNTAVEGLDFKVGCHKLVFIEHGDQVCSVEIINDSEKETEEIFYLSLTSAHPSNSVVLHPDTFIFKIEANDDTASQNDQSLLPILLPLIVVIALFVVITALIIIVIWRKKKKASKTLAEISTEDEHIYDVPDIPSKSMTDPQTKPSAEDDKERKGPIGTAAVNVLPLMDRFYQEPSVCIPKYTANPRRDHGQVDVGVDRPISDFEEPETEENVAYGTIQLPTLQDYVEPQVLLRGTPAARPTQGTTMDTRPRLTASEAQSAEAYAITTL